MWKSSHCGLCWLQSLHLESRFRVWGAQTRELLKAQVLWEPGRQHSAGNLEPVSFALEICPLFCMVKAWLTSLPFQPWKHSSWSKVQGHSAQRTLLKVFAQDDVVWTEATSVHSALRSHSHRVYNPRDKWEVAQDVRQALVKHWTVGPAHWGEAGNSRCTHQHATRYPFT